MTKSEIIEELNKMMLAEGEMQIHSLTANNVIYHRARKEGMLEALYLIQKLEG